jgi:hypothetical protein
LGRPKLSPETAVVSIRLPSEIILLLDQYAETLRSQTPGLNVTRTDAARAILISGLTDKNLITGKSGGKK